jgi:uncharacterized membrane protein YgcG
VTQLRYIVPSPPTACFSDLTSPSCSGAFTPPTRTIYQIGSDLHAPYIMQSAFSLERQVTKIANVTLTYLNSRGVHQFESLNVNAPLPGTPGSPPTSEPPTYQYSSDGVFRQNQLIARFNIRADAKLSLFGFYALNYANSDASGASSFPTDSHDLGADYGRASFDTRHRLFVGGTIGLPHAFRLSPFMIFNSGSPYNVTVGRNDLNNDTILNDRPAFATDLSRPSVVLTRFGAFDTLPNIGISGQTIVPVSYLTGPNHFTLNLRLAKTFGFGPDLGGKNAAQPGDGPPGGGPPGGGGPRGGGGGGGSMGRGPGGPGGFGGGPPTSTRRYSLTFSVNARNVLNKVNAATPNGTLSSPNFGQSTALAGGPFSSMAANRKIELQAMFSF